MSKRVCLDCPALIEVGTRDGRCTDCRSRHEQARGSSTARGYGYAHQQERKRWIPRVKTGWVHCARCKKRIAATDDWHLDHSDDRVGYLGPSHVDCNTAAPRHSA